MQDYGGELHREDGAMSFNRTTPCNRILSGWVGATMTHPISGIDIAMWDLLEQATGRPVGRLLGGRSASLGCPTYQFVKVPDRVAIHRRSH
jgi:L-alanine-DL-glutamate epimerase-like enolase superfamily enzyme